MKSPMSSFNSEQLEKALLELDDMMHRMAVSEDYILLRQTAKDIKEGNLLSGERVDAGLEERYFTPEALSTIHTYYPGVEEQEHEFKIEFSGVPVYLKRIKKKYSFFKHLDRAIYGPEEYQLPNPFDKYWSSRYLIQ